jgi:hypothetical protein
MGFQRSQTTIPIIRITRSTPVQTPAWKISPIISQPVRATAESNKSTQKFIGILRCGWYTHFYILAGDACRTIGFADSRFSLEFLRNKEGKVLEVMDAEMDISDLIQ